MYSIDQIEYATEQVGPSANPCLRVFLRFLIDAVLFVIPDGQADSLYMYAVIFSTIVSSILVFIQSDCLQSSLFLDLLPRTWTDLFMVVCYLIGIYVPAHISCPIATYGDGSSERSNYQYRPLGCSSGKLYDLLN